ncbi:hypothetical protein T439DRAFT_378069 [Meredithblackwellia eburnea MCA 4105]
MAVSASPAFPILTPAQAAQIPSKSLPIGSQLAYLLDEFTHLALSLFSALSSSTPQPTAATYAALAQVDAKLAGLLPLLAEHTRRQRRIDQLVAKLQQKERHWRSAANTLHSAVKQLEPIVQSGKLDRESMSKAKEANLTPDTILAYARLLAPFTSAPPSSLYPPEQKLGQMDPSGRGLPVGAIPPFPSEAVMRQGRLQFGSRSAEDGGAALGETGEVGARKDANGEPAGPAQSMPNPSQLLELHAKHLAQSRHGADGLGGDSGKSGANGDGDEDDFNFALDLDL